MIKTREGAERMFAQVKVQSSDFPVQCMGIDACLRIILWPVNILACFEHYIKAISQMLSVSKM